MQIQFTTLWHAFVYEKHGLFRRLELENWIQIWWSKALASYEQHCKQGNQERGFNFYQIWIDYNMQDVDRRFVIVMTNSFMFKVKLLLRQGTLWDRPKSQRQSQTGVLIIEDFKIINIQLKELNYSANCDRIGHQSNIGILQSVAIIYHLMWNAHDHSQCTRSQSEN